MRKSAAAGVILTGSILAGCSTTGPFGRERLTTAAPAGASYIGGRGIQVFPSSPGLLDNVRGAMADVGIHSVRQVPEPNGLTALEGLTADNRGVRATIQATGIRSTVAAKIGWFGDEPLTRAFLDRLAGRQGTITPATEAEPAASAADRPEPAANRFLSRRAVGDSVMLRDRLDPGLAPNLVPSINP